MTKEKWYYDQKLLRRLTIMLFGEKINSWHDNKGGGIAYKWKDTKYKIRTWQADKTLGYVVPCWDKNVR